MSTSDMGYDQFNIPGVAHVHPGRGGLPCISITGQLCSGEVYLHGAHITHFQPKGAAPVIFLSKNAFFQSGKPIRGGIPVIFPWFGPRTGMPEAPAHGLVRTLPWTIEAIDLRQDGSVRVVLELESDPAMLASWPHAFKLRLIVIFATTLDITLETRNTSSNAFEFEEALHTYLQTGDVRKTTIEGLAGVEYLDKVDAFKRKPQADPLVKFEGPTDRVYQNTPGACVVNDLASARSIAVGKEGSNATVVWNPWIAGAASMKDFVNAEWAEMVCVETANVGESRITLPAGATHRMRASIHLV
jgi:glucose-6-phosphate 1-epimerase